MLRTQTRYLERIQQLLQQYRQTAQENAEGDHDQFNDRWLHQQIAQASRYLRTLAKNFPSIRSQAWSTLSTLNFAHYYFDYQRFSRRAPSVEYIPLVLAHSGSHCFPLPGEGDSDFFMRLVATNQELHEGPQLEASLFHLKAFERGQRAFKPTFFWSRYGIGKRKEPSEYQTAEQIGEEVIL